ncbi:MAG: type III-B CRISPR module RAMP protein Cmr1 [Thermoguttaceae bacterium]
MPKEIPDCPTKPNAAPEASRRYEVELITPMFGGGVEPRMNDPSFPIRPTAIRGQLQFWWRATIGAQYATLADLRAAQSAVWGSTERASLVQVLVENVQASDPVPCVDYFWDRNARKGKGGFKANWEHEFKVDGKPVKRTLPAYTLFPFQGKPPKGGQGSQPEQMPDKCILNPSFGLRLRYPENIRQEVETAVWAWVNFGGVGSRTRRGCGALYCQDLAPTGIEALADWFKKFVPTSTSTHSWPTVSQIPLLRDEAQDPVTVWDRLIGIYRYFRQGEDFARNPGQGRSRYPEPETIRRITGRRMRRHAPWDDMPDGFPRAEFGLPIVFHFKDEDKGEPPTTTLNPFVEGKALERMASPLILKPLALTKDKALPLILCLNTPRIQQVELQDENKQCLTPRHAVPIRSSVFDAEGSPLHGLSTVGSALEAFLAFARAEGFTEVTR